MKDEGVWINSEKDEEFFWWILRWDGKYHCKGNFVEPSSAPDQGQGRPFSLVGPKTLITW